MKQQLLGKIFAALFILAAGSFLVNLNGQVKVIFENGDDRDNRQQGIAGREELRLNYTIDATGNVALDAETAATDSAIVAFVDTWDDPNAGTTDIASLFGKPFSLVLTTNGKRLDCREKGGLGIQGQNSGRIDGGGSEELYITLEGSVGLVIDSLMYEPTERGGGDNAHFVLRDFDTDSLFFTPAGHYIYTDVDTTFVRDSVIAFDPGLILLRFAEERLTIKESDTLAGGGRVLGLFFTLTEPTNPSVAEISPMTGGDRLDVSTDFVILFNMAMNTAVTEAAITFTPPLTNRVNTWNGSAEELTITSDDLAFFTDYVLEISTDAEAAGGAKALQALVYNYQTLPDSPTVLSTYPVDEAKNVPAGTPMILEFSQSMNVDSVQNALSFDPVLNDLSFSWNGSGTKVVVSSATMENNTEYTATLSTNATDIYGVSAAEPVVFSFTTAPPVSVENTALQDVLIYPNPVSGVLYIRGMSIATVEIHSMTGQLMKSMHNIKEIDLGNIEAGSYFVTVTDNEENSVRKMIVVQ